jgi:hypothetical protein
MKDIDGEIKDDFPSVSKVMKLFYDEFPTEEAARNKAKGDPYVMQTLLAEWEEAGRTSTNMGSRVHYELEIETLKRPLGLPKGPDLAERNANHIAKSASSRALSRQFANVMQESPTRHGSSQRHAMSKSQEHSHIADIEDAQSIVHKNGSGASGAPPGLDAPTCCKRGPMWKVETGQQPKIWMRLDSVLSWHLEECFRLGLTETWCVENDIHYYFNLNTMCQRDLQTGAEQRIRRFLEWNEVTDT